MITELQIRDDVLRFVAGRDLGDYRAHPLYGKAYPGAQPEACFVFYDDGGPKAIFERLNSGSTLGSRNAATWVQGFMIQPGEALGKRATLAARFDGRYARAAQNEAYSLALTASQEHGLPLAALVFAPGYRGSRSVAYWYPRRSIPDILFGMFLRQIAASYLG